MRISDWSSDVCSSDLHDITFYGNENLSARKLKKFMKNTKEQKFYKIFGSKKYVPAKYEEDKEKLLSEYMKRGFRDIAIVSDSVYRYDDRSVNVEDRKSTRMNSSH